MPAKAAPPIQEAPVSDRDFRLFQTLLYDITGINLPPSKKSLLCSRLGTRLRARGIQSYADYHALLQSKNESAELQQCIDRLTTNETSFFRESRHFEILEREVLPPLRTRGGVRIWSAACSSGQEPWSLAMTAADVLGNSTWEILGSDISSRVLEKASQAHYPMEQASKIPPARLRAHCLKGVGSHEGNFTMSPALRSHVRFAQINLNKPLPSVGQFDAIFLRNVLIYFERDMQRAIVTRLLQQLKPDGWFFIGHSESLNSVTDAVVAIAPTVYRLRK